MKDAYKSFLDALNIFDESIRTWTNSLRRSNLYNQNLKPSLIPLCTFLIIFFTISACENRRTTEQQRSTDMQTMEAPEETQLQEREQSDTVPGVGAERVIEMEAKDHVYFPREITARPGEQFYINLINGGNEPHNIHIEFPQAPLRFGENVPIGQSRRLLVAAPTQPGRYQIFCPVNDHRERGMIATLIVE